MRIVFFLFLFLAVPAHASLKVEITTGTHAPIPLASPSFENVGVTDPGLGGKISEVIVSDLKKSGLFRLINPGAYLQSSAQVLAGPRFHEWAMIQAQALLVGRISNEGQQVRVEFYLFDVFNRKSLLQTSLVSSPQNWRRLAHKVADAVYQRLTGEQPYFDTRIVYVAQHGPRTKRVRRLAIMDQDGANHRYLTDGRHMVLTPRFSPTTHEITYLGFDTRPPSVHMMDLQTGQTQVVGRFPGMSYAPRFSVDGRSLIISLTSKGDSYLHTLDLASRKPQKLTQTKGVIETSATYAPDGQTLVFNSDKSGRPHLYTVPATGGEPTQISFGNDAYYTPVWSPRGDHIAFIKKQKDGFYLGLMRPDGTGERLIFRSYLLESPTWAPNGRMLLFAAQSSLKNPSKIYSIDLTGHNAQPLPTPEEATHPAWSPLLP